MNSLRVVLLLTATMSAIGAMYARAGDDATLQRGHDVFQKWCAPCHGAGPDMPGTVALAALYKGSKPAQLEERTDLTPEIIKHFVRTGVSVMPFFRKTEISDADLDALAAYLTKKGPGT